MQDIVEILYRISPLSVLIDLPGEAQLLQGGPAVSNEEPISELVDGHTSELSEMECEAGNGDKDASEDETMSEEEEEDGNDESEEDEDMSELDLVCHSIRELQEYTTQNWTKLVPIPKQHLLVFHAPAFIEQWLSLGMFSEQAVESLHAMGNRLTKKFRNLGPEGSREKTTQRINGMYQCDRSSFKVKGRVGKRRHRPQLRNGKS